MTKKEIHETVKGLVTELIDGAISDIEGKAKVGMTDQERDEAAMAHDEFKSIRDHVGKW